MKSKQQYIPVPHGKIFTQIIGQGIPIIFIHGFTLNHRMWTPQVKYFSKSNKVITYDLRGFGQSSIPTHPYSHDQDITEILNYFKINKAHIVGLSLGGEIALDFAVSNPDYCLSVTTIDGSINGYKSTINWDVHAHQQGLKNAKQNWLNHPVFHTTSKNKYAMNIIKPQIENYSGWHWLNKDLHRTRLKPSTLKRLKEIKCPTQIIIGEKDLDYFHTISNLIQKELPLTAKHIIPNTGHMANLEQPEKVNQLIEKFINNTSFHKFN